MSGFRGQVVVVVVIRRGEEADEGGVEVEVEEDEREGRCIRLE